MWWTISEPIEHVTFLPSIYIEAAFFGFANNAKCVLLSTAQMLQSRLATVSEKKFRSCKMKMSFWEQIM